MKLESVMRQTAVIILSAIEVLGGELEKHLYNPERLQQELSDYQKYMAELQQIDDFAAELNVGKTRAFMVLAIKVNKHIYYYEIQAQVNGKTRHFLGDIVNALKEVAEKEGCHA